MAIFIVVDVSGVSSFVLLLCGWLGAPESSELLLWSPVLRCLVYYFHPKLKHIIPFIEKVHCRDQIWVLHVHSGHKNLSLSSVEYKALEHLILKNGFILMNFTTHKAFLFMSSRPRSSHWSSQRAIRYNTISPCLNPPNSNHRQSTLPI
jgi:hypothetical protein